MNHLYIIRGPSGSGKTTLARKIVEGHTDFICEADNFWGSDYRFNRRKLDKAHQWCRLEVERLMIDDAPTIVVSNTFVKLDRIIPYQLLAQEYNYQVHIIRPSNIPAAEKLYERTVNRGNAIPLEVIENQIKNYEPMMGEKEVDAI